MDLALQLANKPAGGHFTVFRDGTGLIRLLRSLKKEYTSLEDSSALFEKLEAAVIGLLGGHLFPHEFESFCDAVDAAEDVFETDIAPHIDDAITRQLEDIDASISDIDSESELGDYKTALRKYAPRVGVTDLNTVFRAIDRRIEEISSQSDEAESPRSAVYRPQDKDQFDDKALQNLFAPLLIA